MIKTLHVTYVTCHMSQMLHVTCHKSQDTNNYTKDPVCYIFLESSCKIQFNGHDKNVACYMSHVTCHTCYMSQISTNKQFYQRPNVSYIFEKLMQKKYSSMVMIKTLHVTCVTIHMSHMLHVMNIN